MRGKFNAAVRLKVLSWIVLSVLLTVLFGPGHQENRSYHPDAAKFKFKTTHPCPLTDLLTDPCPGYVVEEITPFACGGPDGFQNMEWLTEEQAGYRAVQRYRCIP
jgi:hypothetical protein